MQCFPGAFHSRRIQLSHEEALAAGRVVVSAAAIEGLGTALLEEHGYCGATERMCLIGVTDVVCLRGWGALSEGM